MAGGATRCGRAPAGDRTGRAGRAARSATVRSPDDPRHGGSAAARCGCGARARNARAAAAAAAQAAVVLGLARGAARRRPRAGAAADRGAGGGRGPGHCPRPAGSRRHRRGCGCADRDESGRGVRARAADGSEAMTMVTSAGVGEDRASRWLVLGSLALNLFFVGAGGALLARHYLAPPAATPAPVDRTVSARIERLAATLPAADAEIVRAEYHANAANVEASRAGYRNAQDEVRRILRTEPFQGDAMRAAMTQQRAARQ